MLTSQEAEQRVAKGAAWLDLVRPGWAERIDVGTLRLEHSCRCILAQTYGCVFETAAYHAGLHVYASDTIDLGFTVDHGNHESGTQYYAQLQDAWVALIAKRLHPDPIDVARDPVGVPQVVQG